MADTGEPIIEMRNIVKRFGSVEALSGVSLTVRRGEVLGLLGDNGAGKSTALKLMAGLIVPERGGVTIDDLAIAAVPPKILAQRIAYLPQDRTVHWPLAADRVVALGRLPHRSFAAGESAGDQQAIRAAMRRMDVLQFANRPVTELSGGERARVLVARALAQEAKFLIADEPAAGLDPAHSLALFEEFARLAQDGHGVLTALHDLSLALRFATRVILLRDGLCLADGQPAQVLNKENLATAFEIDAIVTDIGGIPVVLPHASLRAIAT